MYTVAGEDRWLGEMFSFAAFSADFQLLYHNKKSQ